MIRDSVARRFLNESILLLHCSSWYPGTNMLSGGFLFSLLKFLLFMFTLCMCAKSLQSCLMLCDPLDCSPPGSSVCGILQARILEWVAMPSSQGSSQPRNRTLCLLCLLRWQAGSLPLDIDCPVPLWKKKTTELILRLTGVNQKDPLT